MNYSRTHIQLTLHIYSTKDISIQHIQVPLHTSHQNIQSCFSLSFINFVNKLINIILQTIWCHRSEFITIDKFTYSPTLVVLLAFSLGTEITIENIITLYRPHPRVLQFTMACLQRRVSIASHFNSILTNSSSTTWSPSSRFYYFYAQRNSTNFYSSMSCCNNKYIYFALIPILLFKCVALFTTHQN